MSSRAWSLENPGNRAARGELTEALLTAAAAEIRGSGSLLDCGCGSGWLLAALAEAGVEPRRLHGVEIDPARLEAAHERVPGAEIVEADATSLPFPDAAFDAVFFVVSLSSMGEAATVRAALAEGRRVLAPTGLLAVYEPRLPNPFNPRTRKLRRADLGSAGIEPVESRSLTLLPALGRRLGRLSDRLHPALSRLPPLRSHRLLTHRKPAAISAERDARRTHSPPARRPAGPPPASR